jgi:DNA mismatch endonuclease (patch repair protein)
LTEEISEPSYVRTEEHKEKQRQITLAKWSDPNSKMRSKERSEKIKMALTGKVSPKRGRKENPHSEEHKAKIREGVMQFYNSADSEGARAKIRESRAKQKFPFNDTSIELELQEALMEEGIKFTPQKYELKGTPDIFIEPNICIFADGDYWHNIPKQIEKDKNINKYLISEGYEVLRFWEHDIHKNLEKCINDIKAKRRNI